MTTCMYLIVIMSLFATLRAVGQSSPRTREEREFLATRICETRCRTEAHFASMHATTNSYPPGVVRRPPPLLMPLSPEAEARVIAFVKLHDKNGNGRLDRGEFVPGKRILPPEAAANREEMERRLAKVQQTEWKANADRLRKQFGEEIFSKLDLNHDGLIDREERIAFWKQLRGGELRPLLLSKMYDANKDGLLDANEERKLQDDLAAGKYQ